MGKFNDSINDMKSVFGSPSKDMSRALKPVKTAGAFTIEQGGKLLPLAVKVLSLPLHGLNYAFYKFKNRSSIAANPYDYQNSKITKASNFIGQQLYKIPKNIANGLRK